MNSVFMGRNELKIFTGQSETFLGLFHIEGVGKRHLSVKIQNKIIQFKFRPAFFSPVNDLNAVYDFGIPF